MSAEYPVLPVREVCFRWNARRRKFLPTREGGTLVTKVDARGRPVISVWRSGAFGGLGQELAGWRLAHDSPMLDPAEVVAFLEAEARRRRGAARSENG